MAGLRKHDAQHPSILLQVPNTKRPKLIKCIKELKGHYLDSKYFEKSATHLICDVITCSEKFLGACAKGLWILPPAFIEDSHQVGQWLDEKDYEFSVYDEDQPRDLIAASKRWRWRVSMFQEQPFKDWQVAVVMESGTAQYERLLVFGGAKLIKLSFPFRFTNNMQEISYVFMDVANRELAAELLEFGIMSLHFKFIVDTILKDGELDPLQYAIGTEQNLQDALPNGPHCLSQKETKIVNIDEFDQADIQEIKVKTEPKGTKPRTSSLMIKQEKTSPSQKTYGLSSVKTESGVERDSVKTSDNLKTSIENGRGKARKSVAVATINPNVSVIVQQLDHRGGDLPDIGKKRKLDSVGSTSQETSLSKKKCTKTLESRSNMTGDTKTDISALPHTSSTASVSLNVACRTSHVSSESNSLNHSTNATTDQKKSTQKSTYSSDLSRRDLRTSQCQKNGASQSTDQNFPTASAVNDTTCSGGSRKREIQTRDLQNKDLSAQDDEQAKPTVKKKYQIQKKNIPRKLSPSKFSREKAIKRKSVKILNGKKKDKLTIQSPVLSINVHLYGLQQVTETLLNTSAGSRLAKKKGVVHQPQTQAKHSAPKNASSQDTIKKKSIKNLSQNSSSSLSSQTVEEISEDREDEFQTPTGTGSSFISAHSTPKSSNSSGPTFMSPTKTTTLSPNIYLYGLDQALPNGAHIKLEGDIPSVEDKDTPATSQTPKYIHGKQKTESPTPTVKLSQSSSQLSTSSSSRTPSSGPKHTIQMSLKAFGFSSSSKSTRAASTSRQAARVKKTSGKQTKRGLTRKLAAQSAEDEAENLLPASDNTHQSCIPAVTSEDSKDSSDDLVSSKVIRKDDEMDSDLEDPFPKDCVVSKQGADYVNSVTSSTLEETTDANFASPTAPVSNKIDKHVNSDPSERISQPNGETHEPNEPTKHITSATVEAVPTSTCAGLSQAAQILNSIKASPRKTCFKSSLLKAASKPLVEHEKRTSADITSAPGSKSMPLSKQLLHSLVNPNKAVQAVRRSLFQNLSATLEQPNNVAAQKESREQNVEDKSLSTDGDTTKHTKNLIVRKSLFQLVNEMKENDSVSTSSAHSSTAVGGLDHSDTPGTTVTNYSASSSNSRSNETVKSNGPVLLTEDMIKKEPPWPLVNASKKIRPQKGLSNPSQPIVVSDDDNSNDRDNTSDDVDRCGIQGTENAESDNQLTEKGRDVNKNDQVAENVSNGENSAHRTGNCDKENVSRFNLKKLQSSLHSDRVKAKLKAVLSKVKQNNGLQLSGVVSDSEKQGKSSDKRHSKDVNSENKDISSSFPSAEPELSSVNVRDNSSQSKSLIPNESITSHKAPGDDGLSAEESVTEPKSRDTSSRIATGKGQTTGDGLEQYYSLTSPPSLSESAESDISDIESFMSSSETTTIVADKPGKSKQTLQSSGPVDDHVEEKDKGQSSRPSQADQHSYTGHTPTETGSRSHVGWTLTYPSYTTHDPSQDKATLSVLYGQWMEAARELDFFDVAILHGRPTSERLPTTQLLSEMMELVLCGDSEVSVHASSYLSSWLELHPPVTSATIKLYTEAFKLVTNSDYLFTIINSITDENQDYAASLLEYVVTMFEINFDHCLRSGDRKVVQSAMMIKWLWGNHYIVDHNKNTRQLFDIFDCMASMPQLNLRSYIAICALVSMTAECLRFRGVMWNLQNSSFILDTVHVLCRKLVKSLQDVLASRKHDVIVTALGAIHPAWLRVLVVSNILSDYNQYLLREPINTSKVSLHNIVSQYFFLVPQLNLYHETECRAGGDKSTQRDVNSKNHEGRAGGDKSTQQDLNSNNHEGRAGGNISVQRDLNHNNHEERAGVDKSRQRDLNTNNPGAPDSPNRSNTTYSSPNKKLTPEKVNKRNLKGECALHRACMKNNAEELKRLLAVPGADVNMQDNSGWTPLHEACNHGSYECVLLLLSFSGLFEAGEKPSKVDIDSAGPDGLTPLQDAAQNGHVEVCKLLLKYGGQHLLKTKTKDGRTAMDFAVSDELKEVLESFNQPVEGQGVSDVPNKSDMTKGSPNKTLTAQKVNKRNGKGECSLHIACMKNNAAELERLLAVPGADVNMRDYSGWTPLHEACNHGSYECVELLLKFMPSQWAAGQCETSGRPSKVDIDSRGPDGLTPLQDAAWTGHIEVCKLLLKYGGQRLLRSKTETGCTAIDFASTEEMKEVLESFDQPDWVLNQSGSAGSQSQSLDAESAAACDTAPLMSLYKELVSADHTRMASRDECAIFLSLLKILISSYFDVLLSSAHNGDSDIVLDQKDREAVGNMGVHLTHLRRHIRKLMRPEDLEHLQFDLDILEAACMSKRDDFFLEAE